MGLAALSLECRRKNGLVSSHMAQQGSGTKEELLALAVLRFGLGRGSAREAEEWGRQNAPHAMGRATPQLPSHP